MLNRKESVLAFLLAAVIVILVIVSFGSSDSTEIKVPKQDAIDSEDRRFELDIVESDLKTTGTLSPELIQSIVNGIDSSSNEFNVPVGLLHSIFRVESEYRFWITHPTVRIKLSKGTVTTNAIGLGGIVWECWSDTLIKRNIARAKSDLYRPIINIRAAAVILNVIISQEIDSATEWSVIKNIIRRYYGAYDHNYHDKLIKITSDLWLKRIAKEIFTSYKVIEIPDSLERM